MARITFPLVVVVVSSGVHGIVIWPKDPRYELVVNGVKIYTECLYQLYNELSLFFRDKPKGRKEKFLLVGNITNDCGMDRSRLCPTFPEANEYAECLRQKGDEVQFYGFVNHKYVSFVECVRDTVEDERRKLYDHMTQPGVNLWSAYREAADRGLLKSGQGYF
ncbi:uncharacterized protein LOC135387489 isoform X2 [Ornithodoros turicata]|uniref:uncharacterized protein LOC135387489 isoform X2 n=1 Tax=Ornithodoros turicata TaxID=34597 RepID=UPI0031393D01